MGFRKVMIKVGIIGSGNWALALTKILTNVKIVVKARINIEAWRRKKRHFKETVGNGHEFGKDV